MTDTSNAESSKGLLDGDRTVPPSSNLRTVMAADLYAMMPELKEDIQLQPRPDETMSFMLARLRSSTTPEEAVTMVAYAFQPRISVWWAHECVATMREHLTPIDHKLLEMIGAWASGDIRDRDAGPVQDPRCLAGLGDRRIRRWPARRAD